MERQETQSTITPQNTKVEEGKMIITDAQGDSVVIMLKEENQAAVDQFVETAEGFHSNPYRYEKW